MKVAIIPIVIVIGAIGTVTKGLLKELEDLEIRRQVKSIKTVALLSLARILRRVLETWGDLLSLKLQWKAINVSWREKNTEKLRIRKRIFIQFSFLSEVTFEKNVCVCVCACVCVCVRACN